MGLRGNVQADGLEKNQVQQKEGLRSLKNKARTNSNKRTGRKRVEQVRKGGKGNADRKSRSHNK